MTTDEKLVAILAAVQVDPGNRGLARDPADNLFTATAGDFQAACRSIADCPRPWLALVTGFLIPSADPPAFETDGPLGAVFLAEAFADHRIGLHLELYTDPGCLRGLLAGYRAAGLESTFKHPRRAEWERVSSLDSWTVEVGVCPRDAGADWFSPAEYSHLIALERAGPAANGRCHTMRGRDITDQMRPAHLAFEPPRRPFVGRETIGIGDGGNEIGMGKVPHETVVKNIPNGDLVHCRVPTDHLIVTGVSNWGAYALAAGVYVLRGVTPSADLFDPDREREILEVMVREGPLVDGVTGKPTATVDGLTWDEYVRPLVRIREILEA